MTLSDVARYRFSNQLIARQTARTPADVVAWLGAIQAQDFLGAKWSVGLRAPGVSEATVEQALADRTIVRTWPMRGTLHFVAPDDVRWMLSQATAMARSQPLHHVRRREPAVDPGPRRSTCRLSAAGAGESLSRRSRAGGVGKT